MHSARCVVDGHEITGTEFRRAYMSQLNAYRAAAGAGMNEQLLRQLGIDQQVLQQMVDERAALTEADRLGIAVSLLSPGNPWLGFVDDETGLSTVVRFAPAPESRGAGVARWSPHLRRGEPWRLRITVTAENSAVPAAGRRNVKVVPTPGSLETPISPPSSRTMP